MPHAISSSCCFESCSNGTMAAAELICCLAALCGSDLSVSRFMQCAASTTSSRPNSTRELMQWRYLQHTHKGWMQEGDTVVTCSVPGTRKRLAPQVGKEQSQSAVKRHKNQGGNNTALLQVEHLQAQPDCQLVCATAPIDKHCFRAGQAQRPSTLLFTCPMYLSSC